MIIVRSAGRADEDAIWRILEPIVRAGETYALPRDWPRADALGYWLAERHEAFVAENSEDSGAVLGTYYMQANQLGGGGHVANCGYATATDATGKGVARAMCAHSLDHARARGFRAMQFNFVVASNERAVRLWRHFGFQTAGVLPEAFDHPSLGLVDALVMHRKL